PPHAPAVDPAGAATRVVQRPDCRARGPTPTPPSAELPAPDRRSAAATVRPHFFVRRRPATAASPSPRPRPARECWGPRSPPAFERSPCDRPGAEERTVADAAEPPVTWYVPALLPVAAPGWPGKPGVLPASAHRPGRGATSTRSASARRPNRRV